MNELKNKMIQLLWQSNEYFIQHLKSLNFIEGCWSTFKAGECK